VAKDASGKVLLEPLVGTDQNAEKGVEMEIGQPDSGLMPNEISFVGYSVPIVSKPHMLQDILVRPARVLEQE
jgi:hypothetical protein